MGVYLSKPNTEKASQDGFFPYAGAQEEVPYAVSEMQGWRKSMEDAHISEGRVSEDVSVFAVFDGHGGKEVAAFCARHFVDELTRLPAFKSGDMKSALRNCFHRIDDMLRDEANAAELSALRDKDDAITASMDATDSDSDDEDAANGMDDEGEAASGADAVAARAVGAAGAVSASAVTALPRTAQESKEALKEQVKQRMSEAEQKGSLSKAEALQLVMNMMKLKKLDEGASASSSSSSSSSSGSTDPGGVTIGARYTEAGCTAIVCLLRGRTLFVANAGDSRAVLCSDGDPKPLSVDHKPQSPDELRRITRAGGTVSEVGRVNGNLNLSRSIGDLRYKVDPSRPVAEQVITAEPDITETQLDDAADYVFIACDGVFDVMSNADAVEFVSRRLAFGVEPPSRILEQVFEECMCDNPTTAGGIGADNMTGCLVLLKPLAYFKADGAAEADDGKLTAAQAGRKTEAKKNNATKAKQAKGSKK